MLRLFINCILFILLLMIWCVFINRYVCNGFLMYFILIWFGFFKLKGVINWCMIFCLFVKCVLIFLKLVIIFVIICCWILLFIIIYCVCRILCCVIKCWIVCCNWVILSFDDNCYKKGMLYIVFLWFDFYNKYICFCVEFNI